jgi:hypothetical protein
MTPDESAVAALIEEADWDTLRSHMNAKFTGEVIVQQMVEDHLDEVEKLSEDKEAVDAVPAELELADAEK